MKNTAAEVSARIEKMIAEKAAEVEAVEKRLEENTAEIVKQEGKLAAAMEKTDAAAYKKAKDAKADAEATAEMLGKRLEQIHSKKFVTESDSDAVIDDLLKYEDALAAEYEEAIKKQIERLQKIHDEYIALVAEAEKTIHRWTNEIHAYHRVKGTVFADGSSYSKAPVPVHRMPYTGCEVSHRVEKFLNTVYPRKGAFLF